MNIFDGIIDGVSLMSGIALFLYGLAVMERSLDKLSGSQLERLLNHLTASPVRAVVLGVAITSLVQSSVSVTILVVGLVNSGMLALLPAVGIVMGANIGTTVTAQLLRLSETQSSSALVQLFTPAFLGPFAALIGAVLYVFFRRKTTLRNIGHFLVGFGLLFLSMEYASQALKPLAESDMLSGIFASLKNPVLGVLAGMLAAMLLQSSSATVGVLQTLARTGVVTYASAVPIVLGINVGICVLPLFASIGASKNAKRSALANAYFNLIGSALFLTVIYTLKNVLVFTWWDSAVTMGGIANFHAAFNIIVTLLFLPFIQRLIRLTQLTLPDRAAKADREGIPVMDKRLLKTPPLAIRQASAVLSATIDAVNENYAQAMPVLFSYSGETIHHINRRKRYIEQTEEALSGYLIQLSEKAISQQEATVVTEMRTCLVEYDRISACTESIAACSGEMMDAGLSFSDIAVRELYLIDDAVMEILEITKRACVDSDEPMAKHVEPLAEVIRRMTKTLRERHTQRVREGVCNIETGNYFLAVLTQLEHVGNHCSNIAACVLHGGVGSRSLAKQRTTGASDEGAARFNEMLGQYRQKYCPLLDLQESPMPEL